jgi:hypothetical protein
MNEKQPITEQLEPTPEQRLAVSQGLIEAARNAVLNGEPVDMEGLDPLLHGQETVVYVRQLSRRGIAALDSHQIRL